MEVGQSVYSNQNQGRSIWWWIACAVVTVIVASLAAQDLFRRQVANLTVGQIDGYATRWNHEGVLVQTLPDNSVVKELRTEHSFGQLVTRAVIRLPHMTAPVVSVVPTPPEAAAYMKMRRPY